MAEGGGKSVTGEDKRWYETKSGAFTSTPRQIVVLNRRSDSSSRTPVIGHMDGVRSHPC